jgi:hypothetical protein
MRALIILFLLLLVQSGLLAFALMLAGVSPGGFGDLAPGYVSLSGTIRAEQGWSVFTGPSRPESIPTGPPRPRQAGDHPGQGRRSTRLSLRAAVRCAVARDRTGGGGGQKASPLDRSRAGLWTDPAMEAWYHASIA